MDQPNPQIDESPVVPVEPPEPRWPALITVIAVGGLNMALPQSMLFGPRWLLLVVVICFLVPIHITHRNGEHAANHLLGQIVSAIITLSLVGSLVLLIHGLITHTETAVEMLRSAAELWITNILVFATWYWRLDAGGPNARDMRGVHSSGAFLFPQMTLAPEYADEGAGDVWSPQFIDYLFLSFNTSTALSPTDTAVLSRWAKAFCMGQASISLTIIVILAARAVNIL